MTVDTQYSSLDEMIEIYSVDGRPLSQFYYRGTTDVWKPNRKSAPLTLGVKMTVVDPDTKRQYTPSITNVKWYVIGTYNKSTGEYVYPDNDTSQTPETTVPMIVATGSEWYMVNNSTDNIDHNYVALSNKNLKVRKNVPPETDEQVGAVTILAYITYTDPRTGGSLYAISTIMLTTDLDADGKYDVHIQTPKVVEFDPFDGQAYNITRPLEARKSITAKAYYGDQVLASGVYYEWLALDGTTEKKVDVIDIANNTFFAFYVSGQGTDTLTYNPLFANNVTIICRIRKTTDTSLKPCRDTVTLAWKIPDISCEAYSPQGSTVRDSSPDKVMTMLYNAQGYGTLSNAMIDSNLRIKWYKRVSTADYSLLGWGRELTVSASSLTNSSVMSNNVMAETYLLNEYKPITSDDGSKLLFLDSAKTIVICERTM